MQPDEVHAKRELVDSAALDAFIDYANSARDRADSQFCVGVAEYEHSDKEFEVLLAALERRPIPAAVSRWKRISLELSHTWPGQLLLRFEPADGPAAMVEVTGADLDLIGVLNGGRDRSTTSKAPA